MRPTSWGPSFVIEARGRRFSGSHTLGHARVSRGRQVRAFTPVIAMVILLAACSSSAQPAGSSTVGSSPVPTSAPTAATGPSAKAWFPLQLRDDEGTSVSIPAEPRQIVSLTPGTTEILFALGIGDRVVATDSASDYPPAAVPLPDVAAFGSLDAEKIVGIRADLVVAGGNGYTPPDGVAKLRSLGIPVLVVYAASVDGVADDVELVGRAVGRSAQAAELAGSMRTEIDALAGAVRDLAKPRTFYEIDASKEIYGPADHSFLAEMVGLAGGAPITSGSPDNFQIPLERLIAADPEVIVLGDAAHGVAADQVAKRPGWSGMTAVRTGTVRVADDKLIARPGPRLGQGLRSLILAIHPEATLP